GTVVKTNEKEHPELRNKIVTSDMDAMQLVTDKTCVSSLHKGYQSTECFYPAEVEKKYGLRPDQIVDFKALQGDSSDNIPGVKGIGKVGALQLLQEFGSLDGIYRHLDQVKGKKHDLLTEQKEQAYFSQELATIKTDVPLDYTLEACTAHDFNQNAATALFESLQFYSIIRRMQQWKKGGNMKKGSGLKKEEVAKIFGNREVQSQLF
ncbi:MAG: 5'-3' exonuclease H3TH domain-containing protein, partial [bacterium]|nr:5'-3' exonuclease H3TH domain-containing protein [bacterium]